MKEISSVIAAKIVNHVGWRETESLTSMSSRYLHTLAENL